MQALNLPNYPFKIVENEGKLKIFDPLRKRYLVLTPEEWVRQHFIQFLVKEKGFPGGLFSIEHKVKHHQRSGRYDALCLDRHGRPLFLLECKAPEVAIGSASFDQVLRYNQSIGAPFLALTNGMDHYVIRVDFQEREMKFLPELPDFEYLAQQIEAR